MALTIAAGCTSGWTAAERELIEGQPAVMRVLTVEDESDLEVLRTPCRDIDISYTSPETGKEVTENIKGFTAVIFQHETDHLQGVLYIDKLEPAAE